MNEIEMIIESRKCYIERFNMTPNKIIMSQKTFNVIKKQFKANINSYKKMRRIFGMEIEIENSINENQAILYNDNMYVRNHWGKK